MTKHELTELTLVEGACVGGALALLSTVVGTLTGFSAFGIGCVAAGLAVSATAMLVANREPEPEPN
ncbi:hypothetical protein [Endothiovibrio diazotrophicus]